MMKKGTLILTLTFLLLAAFSCGSGNLPESSSVPQKNDVLSDGNENESDAIFDFTEALSNERFDGYNFRILVRKGQIGTQFFDEPQEDIVDSAVYERNKAVEERYGITISALESTSGNYDLLALDSILAGDDAYDIIFAHSRAAFVYAVSGACLNIHDISTIHLDKPWWSKDIAESCDVGGKLFILDGDISVDGLEKAMCMYFNKRIFDELGFDYPYELVRDGDWTFEEFAYYARKGGRDLDGDGILNPEVDQFGFGANGAWHAPVNILYANTRDLGGMAVGEMILQLPDDKKVQENMIAYLKERGLGVDELEGYVNHE